MRELRNEINSSAVIQAIRTIGRGNPLSTSQIEAIENVSFKETRLRSLFRDAYLQGGRTTEKVLSDVRVFSSQHPRVLEWARTEGSQRIQEINSETRNGVRSLVAEALRTDLPPRQLAEQLRSSIGLTFRQTQQVAEYRGRMLDRGESSARANARASEYAQSLRTQRVNAIADTEMTYAVEAGKREYYQQAAEAGIIPDDTILVWLTENDDRVDEVCQLMAGQHTDIFGYFQTPYGPEKYPPLHPYCRCTVVPEEGVRGGRLFRGISAPRTKDQVPATPRADARTAAGGAGQSINRFTNLLTGHRMGKTETGDTYESMLLVTQAGQRIIQQRFGSSLVPISNVAGKSRTTPVDFELPGTHGVELKTIHADALNKKTAIKAEEKARKMEYVNSRGGR